MHLDRRASIMSFTMNENELILRKVRMKKGFCDDNGQSKEHGYLNH